jgi:hypothetical protein
MSEPGLPPAPFLIVDVVGRPASFATAHEAAWKSAVRSAIASLNAPVRDCRFGVVIDFRTPAAKNANEVWDLDNLIKPTLDAMEGVFGDRPWRGRPQPADDRVDYLQASKRPIGSGGATGARIQVYDLTQPAD